MKSDLTNTYTNISDCYSATTQYQYFTPETHLSQSELDMSHGQTINSEREKKVPVVNLF